MLLDNIRLFDDNVHDWKIIPFVFINKYLGKYLKFHSNLNIHCWLIKKFPKYYQEIIGNWSQKLSCIAKMDSAILSQFTSQLIGNSDTVGVFFFNFLLIKIL